MSEEDDKKIKITPLMQRQDHCQRVVRRIAANSENVFFPTHAFEREEYRDISTSDALEVLLTGDVEPGISPGENAGEWVCKVTKKLFTSRPVIGVVTVVMNEKELLVVTLEWEYP
ncbi:MAG: hypothetical protein ACKVRO_08350 [Micropepsaceae bacterium]